MKGKRSFKAQSLIGRGSGEAFQMAFSGAGPSSSSRARTAPTASGPGAEGSRHIMQSPIFAYNDQQTQEPWSLQNKQVLARRPHGADDDVPARKGHDGRLPGARRVRRRVPVATTRRARARHTGEGLNLMRCHGQGTVYLANLAQQRPRRWTSTRTASPSTAALCAGDGLRRCTTRSSRWTASTASPARGKYQLNITGGARSP